VTHALNADSDPAINAELARILQSLERCLAIRDKYITSSLQCLGDNPRDHDGHFFGLSPDLAAPCGMRPDADVNAPRLNSSEFKPWNIYPRPPGPHWHWTEPTHVIPKGGHTPPAKEEFDFASCEIPGGDSREFKLDERGVYQIYDGVPSMLLIWPELSLLMSGRRRL
jgi:AMP deaminase